MGQPTNPSKSEGNAPLPGRDLANLTAAVLHEINNALNGVALQIAVMEQKGGLVKWQEEVNSIRSKIASAAAMAHRLHQVCYIGPTAVQPVDLNSFVRKTVAEWQRKDPELTFNIGLASDVPMPLAEPDDLKRLVNLLIQEAIEATQAGSACITISTASNKHGIELRVVDAGLPIRREAEQSLFEPFSKGRTGGDNLRLCLCRSLAKRLHGDIHAENLADGGVAMIVQLPISTQDTLSDCE
jgi:C4-dicarboxylate-specific signal transduction histidine kinase